MQTIRSLQGEYRIDVSGSVRLSELNRIKLTLDGNLRKQRFFFTKNALFRLLITVIRPESIPKTERLVWKVRNSTEKMVHEGSVKQM